MKLESDAHAVRVKMAQEETKIQMNESDIWYERRLKNESEIHKYELEWLAIEQRERDKQAQAEIRQINETTYLFKEHKLAALEELIEEYKKLGDEGKLGLARVRGEMTALRGDTRATGVVVQDVAFDIGKMWQSVHQGLATTIGDTARFLLGMKSSVQSWGDAVKSFFLD